MSLRDLRCIGVSATPGHTGLTLMRCGGVELPDVLGRRYDIRTAQESPGHKDLRTTQVHAHVMRQGANAVQSPLGRRAAAAPRAAPCPDRALDER
jgi:integrase